MECLQIFLTWPCNLKSKVTCNQNTLSDFKITHPRTPEEFEEYFDLRWRILRAPWGQPRGSEKDTMEEDAEHISISSDNGLLIGVGRLHQLNSDEAQIRYMAVENNFRNQGVGLAIYSYLENIAYSKGHKIIILNARLSAISFYEHLGFIIIKDGDTLFKEIEHKVMQKEIIL
jgi:N-acetylglutamate synthase-like GNAT family acetyltransferase